MVCAWMPCEASTSSNAPSQAAIDLDTSYEKIHVPRCIYKIKGILLTIRMIVIHLDGMTLWLYPALFQIHIVEGLVDHVSLRWFC